MAYPPRGLAKSVQLWNVGGLPVSVGLVPGCNYRVAVWGLGAPRPFRDGIAGPSGVDFKCEGGKRVDDQAFRRLIAIRGSGR